MAGKPRSNERDVRSGIASVVEGADKVGGSFYPMVDEANRTEASQLVDQILAGRDAAKKLAALLVS